MSGLGLPQLVRVESRRGTFTVYDTLLGDQILILLHGLGATSQTFGCFVKSLPEGIRAIAFDCRGHGNTKFDDPLQDLALSSENLVRDGFELISQLLPNPTTKFVLCGHSMGGAIAVRLASAMFPERCAGLVVIEAIEGVALRALENPTLLNGSMRPERFRTLQDALAWSCSPAGPLPGASFSASVSIPDQLKTDSSGLGLVWKTNPLTSVEYWLGWFVGLSDMFLKCPVRWKALVVSQVDKLDAELTVGQMQGKFQLVVMPGTGHFVHEIAPGQTCARVAQFIVQHVAPARQQQPRGLSASEIIALRASLRQFPG
ncbi:hypothetical protein BASA81_000357 [Batrachochytrium salamandrivorans]|nr:hypothetical protein BASA81_000357 [Batrachochytrium salamandrivorans]